MEFVVEPADSNGMVVFWVIFFAVMALLGFLAADIWKSKGGNFVSGFLTGFVLGPVGILYVGFAKPGDGPCPLCHNRVRDDVIRCPTCHGDIARSAPSA